MSTPPFWVDQRKTVLWVGPPPAKPILAGACNHNGLCLREVTVDEVAALAPESRALLLPILNADAAFMKRARMVAQLSAQHGVTLAVVMSNEAESPKPPREDEVKEYYKAVKKLRKDGFEVEAFDYHWVEIAGRLARLTIKGGENRSLVLRGAELEGEQASLLRQAFYDYRAIEIEILEGGKSGAQTLRVCDVDVPPKNRPFVAKLSTPAKIQVERSGYLWVEKHVPSRLYAPLVEERCRVGNRYALAVYRFVEHCDPLSVRVNDVGIAYVDNLFSHTLRDLHGPQTNEVGLVAELYGDAGCKLLRWTDALNEAGIEARKTNRQVPGSVELKAMIEELPRHDYKAGTIHGDPHVGNLFVPAGLREAIIIDYGSVRHAPVQVDPAVLEVSLAFPPLFVTGRPAEHEAFRNALLEAYAYPLSQASARKLQPILGAKSAALVRRIRQIASGMDPNPTGYPIAVAACLLRYASHLDSGSLASRALAYELAAHLFSDACVAMHQRKAKSIGGL